MALSDMYAALVAGWKLNNSLVDDVAAYDLANVNSTPLNATGKFSDAADFTPASSHSLEVASASDLQILDKKWFAVMWVYLDVNTGYQTALGKWGTAGNEWLVEIDLGVPTFYGGSGGLSVGGSALSTGAWHLIVIAHDPDANLKKISVDGGAFVTASLSGGITGTSNKLRFGSYDGETTYWLDGRMDDVAIGAGYVPTDADAAAIWASGAGVAWADWGSAGTFTATSALTAAPATTAVSATSTPPTFSASATLAAAPTTLSAAGTTDPPTFSGTAALVAAPATLAAEGTTTPPVFSGTAALVAGPATSSSTATATPPTFTASAALSAAAAVLAASATYGTASAVFPSGGLIAREGYVLRAREGYALTVREGYALRAREG